MNDQDRHGTVVVSSRCEFDLIVDVLEKHGATNNDAQLQATILVEGDLRGQHSHGLRRVPVLAKRLKNKVTASGVEPVVSYAGSARAHVDGRHGLGPVVAKHAIDTLLVTAKSAGIAMVSVANSGHVGMLAPYVERMADEGFIGLALTTSEALVAPWGGTRAMVGTNPIGIGIPTEGAPLVVDMSTAAVSAGKILDYAARGQDIPLGWAVDNYGNQTTSSVEASQGAIAPFGGPKGYALGLAIEILVGLTTASSLGREVHGTLDTDTFSTKGDLFIAIPSPESPSILNGLTTYLEQLRSEGTEHGSVLIPGDRARKLREERMKDGIPLDKQLWKQITDLATIGE